MSETQPQPTPVEGAPEVPNGLSAVVLPKLGKRNQFDELLPVPEAEALKKLNSFLEGLNQQGADIVSVFDLDVDVGRRPGIMGNVTETKKVAIVRKSGK